MKTMKTAIPTAAAVVVASLALGFAAPALAADPAAAGLTTDGSIYTAGDDGLWHQVDAASLAAGTTIMWYGELPGSIGDPLATVAVRTTQAATAPDAVLAGLIGDGSVYIAGDDGLWHGIDLATLAARGLSRDRITWYGELPGSVGDPVAA